MIDGSIFWRRYSTYSGDDHGAKDGQRAFDLFVLEWMVHSEEDGGLAWWKKGKCKIGG